jgi:ABC-type metal ion transport system substrate-binding protein
MENKGLYLVVLLMLFTLIANACASQPKGKGDLSLQKQVKIVTEKKEGDYIVKFVSDKKQYAPHEPLKILTQIKYVGPNDKLVVEHGGFSPVSYTVTKKGAKHYNTSS